MLTYWSRVTHICVGKLTIIGSDNGLSPGRRQAIIWANTGILLIGPLGTKFNAISIAIETFSFKNSIWKCRLRNGVHFVSASMCYFEHVPQSECLRHYLSAHVIDWVASVSADGKSQAAAAPRAG